MANRYDELYRSFRWDVPARFNIAQACCGRWAADRGRFALYWEDESGATAAYSFWDIQQQANRLSNALAALGVRRGDRVAIVLPQRPETAIAYMAIFQMGAVALPLSHLFGPEALEYRMQHAGASVAIIEPGTLPNLWAIRDRLSQLREVIGVGGARIGICYFIAMLIYLGTGIRGQIIWIAGLLSGYWLLMIVGPLLGCGTGGLEQHGN